MTAPNNAAKEYLRLVSAALPYSRREKARYLQDLRGGLARYIRIYPCATVQALQTRFGTPEQIAADCFNADPLLIASTLSHSRRTRVVTAVCAVCGVFLLSIGSGLAARAYQNSQYAKEGHVVEIIEEDADAEALWEELVDSTMEVN